MPASRAPIGWTGVGATEAGYGAAIGGAVVVRSERSSRNRRCPVAAERLATPPRGAHPTVEGRLLAQRSTKPAYYRAGRAYEDYEPAYRYGWESASSATYRDRKFEDVETDLERGWDKAKGKTREGWRDVKDATRDAFNRVRGH